MMVNVNELCRCGHERTDHIVNGSEPCAVGLCDCEGFEGTGVESGYDENEVTA